MTSIGYYLSNVNSLIFICNSEKWVKFLKKFEKIVK